MSDTLDLLFELGTEELPPKSLKTLAAALRANVEKGLDKLGLEHGEISVYATPRRLAALVRNLAELQRDQRVERRGPALNAAYTAEGTATKATEGFARSCGVTVDQLTVIRTDKGEWVGFQQQVKGAATAELVPELFRQALADLPIAKRMRWGSGNAEFVRPVHWVILLFGDTVIETEILGVKTGRMTRGHRFHSPDPFPISTPAAYEQELLDRGKVIASPAQRRQRIERLAVQAATDVDGRPHLDADLLDEVTALVEWPVPVLGRFNERFLDLPAEVLITTMQENQKYFPVLDPAGRLLPCFITFSNLESSHLATVREGNERVIVPRLSDAEFFWKQDRKKTLESRVPDLATVTYQKTLGSLLDKTHRLETLAVTIAGDLNRGSAAVERAAYLAKADLLTEMVGEFPNLQGVMGRYYATAEGEPEDVAGAIEEHYLPRVSGGPLPVTDAGQILALAEKCDTLAGIFSTGLLPTGDRDPFGLRRAALGAIRILIEKQLDLDLRSVFERALDLFHHAFEPAATLDTLLDFVFERLRGHFLELGYSPDEIEAVLSLKPPRPLDCERRLRAVREFRSLTAADSLAAANKRIRNLLRKSEDVIAGNVDDKRLVETHEVQLFEAARRAHGDLLPLLQRSDYSAALLRLAQLREPVDAFFDHVLVMAEDQALRRNRLGLLALIENLFMNIADVGKLQPQQ